VLTKYYALVNAGTCLIRIIFIEYSHFKIIMRIVINNRVKPLKCQLKAFITILYRYQKKIKKNLAAQIFELVFLL